MSIKVKLFTAGYCKQFEKFAIKDGKYNLMKFYSTFALIEHSQYGKMLFDTGYAPYFYEETKKFPYNIYAKLVPVTFKRNESALFQLNSIGIFPQEIKFVFLSHFHADHIAGARDFHHSKFICSESAYNFVKHKKNLNALSCGFLPNLLPKDFETRLLFIEKFPLVKTGFDVFDFGFDIYGDKSVIGISLDGHSEGQIGLLINGENKKYFFISDACWIKKSYEQNILPSSVVKIFTHKWKRFSDTLKKLNSFYELYPDVKIIPSHCPEVLKNNFL
jgi:glyoxylase-like metal-dependent hydrolase (beta-lactamase superfamily II)